MKPEALKLLQELNSKQVVPKVKTGGQAGVITAILGALVTGTVTGDWQTGLVAAGALAVPVVIQFAAAWIKTDPRMDLARRVLEELNEGQ